MRSWAILALSAAGLATAGCGAVFVPVVQRFPDPVKAVRVVDEQTGKGVPGAHVAYELHRHRGWSHEPPALLDAPVQQADAAGAPAEELRAIRRRDGSFVIRPRRRVGWVQWFFPLPRQDGWDYYRDFAARVRATAPGYEPLALEYAAERPPVMGWSEQAGGGAANLDINGVLWFRLQPRTNARQE